ncbi:hypothetical protein HDV04_000689 [Boothiomyces sp. JEL0838]|nr:hypothetical protein HDV04_000673 [Boothiomyces sp. JEL0838]KAJ3314323.1 hypothetical protein HDV04_000689 [Boothiomyces sp. JEL0838]
MIACDIPEIPPTKVTQQKKVRLPSIRDYITRTENGSPSRHPVTPNSGNWAHADYYPYHYEYAYPPVEYHPHTPRYYPYYNYHPYYPRYDAYTYTESEKSAKQEPTPAQPAKIKRQKKDPSAPKHPMSPFIYYLAEVRSQFTAKNPGKSGGEISKIIATHWRQMSEQDKMKYNQQCLNDKKRYAQEMIEWTRKKSPKPEASEQPQESSSVTFVE